jgi:hypothetical protein
MVSVVIISISSEHLELFSSTEVSSLRYSMACIHTTKLLKYSSCVSTIYIRTELTFGNNTFNYSSLTNILNLYSLLTPWSRVLLEKLTGLQLVKKFPAFYWIWRFITAFTSARHLSLSWVSLIHSIPPYPTSWRSILILSSHLRLSLPYILYFLPNFITIFTSWVF